MLLDTGTSPGWDPSPRQFQFQSAAALPVISCHPSEPAGRGGSALLPWAWAAGQW